jgi:hypothetical protein
MNATTIETKQGPLGWVGRWVGRTLGLQETMERAQREAVELTERWDVPQGDEVPADLRDTQPRFWLTRAGQQIAGRLDVNDMAEGSQSAAAPILLVLFPLLAVLALALSAVAPWLGILPLLFVPPLMVLAWQATNSWLWPLVALVVGVVMPLLGSTTGFGMSLRNPMDLFVMMGTLSFLVLGGAFMAQSFATGIRNGIILVVGFVAIQGISQLLPASLGQAVWFAIGCFLPIIYAHAILKARAMSLIVDAHSHMSEILAGHATAHVGARKQQAEAAARDISPVMSLGVATGIFAKMRDPFAPDPHLPFVISADHDLSTHLIVLGSTGTGKTSGVIRPLVKQWLAAAIGGALILDGKGGLAGEFRDMPDYMLIEPGVTDIALLQGLGPRDALMCLSAQAGNGSQASESSKFFTASAREMLRHALVMLDAVVRYEKGQVAENCRQWRWALHDVFELLVRMQRVTPDQQNRANDLLLYAAGMPEYEESSILVDAINYFENLAVGVDETRSNIWATVQSWLSPIMSDERLLPWAKREQGADVTEALHGGVVGVNLPAFTYGEAGKQVMLLIKQRLHVGMRRRASRDGVSGRKHWREDGETPVAFFVDEAQELTTQGDIEFLPVARGLGGRCIYATQNVDSFYERFGEHGAKKLLDSFRSDITFQSSAATLEWLRDRLGHIRALTFPISSAAIGYAESASIAAASPLFDPTHPGAPEFRKLRRAGAGAISNARREGSEGKAGGHVGWRSNASLNGGAALLLPRVEGGVWQARPLLDEATYAAVTAQPFTAIAHVMRGGVPRRDVIRLTPDFG